MAGGNRNVSKAMGIRDESSKVLLTALSACQDLVPSYWYDSANLTNWTDMLGYSGYRELYAPAAFNKPPWMCRNQTLALAVEDLFNNIKIAMVATNIS